MKWIWALAFTFATIVLTAQNFNRPVPPGFPEYEFEVLDGSFDGYFTTGIKNTQSGQDLKWMAVLDSDGYLLWISGGSARQLDLNYQESTNEFTYSAAVNGTEIGHITLNDQFQTLDTVIAPASYLGDVHEHLVLPNGNTAILGLYDTIVDLTGYTFDGQPGTANTNLAATVLLEITPAGNVIFEWFGYDHVAPDEYQDGIASYDAQYFDYMHANAIDVDFDGHYLLSLRHTSSVVKINRNDGSVMWKLGGNVSDFTFPNDAGFSANHDIRSLGNNRYSLYDNGNLTSNPQESRAVIYVLDTINMTATREWEYKHSPAVYAPAMGNYHHAGQGIGLINWGRAFRPDPTFTLIDTFNNPMVNLYWEDYWISYRSYADDIPINFPRPEITCDQQGGTVTLTASPSNFYWWSTGETTQSITVANTGTYMVWTEYGIGLLGSQPFHLTDLNNPCNLVGIEEHNSTSDQLLMITDLLGREIDNPKAGQVYFLRYQSGKSRKVLWQDGMMVR